MLIMDLVMAPDMSAIFNELTRLTAREDFISFSRLESFRSYKNSLLRDFRAK
jgi:hypothetical protein